MSPRAQHNPARSSGKRPPLGVARQKRVRSAGGRVGQWWSPAWLAELLAAWAGLADAAPAGRRWRVLDAGAGMGALSFGALAHEHVDVTMVERDERLASRLGGLITDELADRARVVHADFLERDERQGELFGVTFRRGFDIVLSNPPWEGDYPERFVLRALDLAPRVCAIVPLNMLCGGARAGFWRTVHLARSRPLPTRPKFKGAKGGMRDVMLIEVRPRAHAHQTTSLEVG